MSDLALSLSSLSANPVLDRDMRETLAGLARALPAALARGGLPASSLKVEAEILADGLEGLLRERAGPVPPESELAAAHLLRLARDLAARAADLAGRGAADLLAEAEVAAQHSPDRGDATRAWALCAALPAPEGRVRAVPTGFEPGACDLGRVTGDFVILTVDRSASCAPADARILPAGGRIAFAQGEAFLLHHAGSIEGGPEEVPTAANFVTAMIQAGKDGAVLEGPAVLSPCAVRIDTEESARIIEGFPVHFPEKGFGSTDIAGIILATGGGSGLAGALMHRHYAGAWQDRVQTVPPHEALGLPEVAQALASLSLVGGACFLFLVGSWKMITAIRSSLRLERLMTRLKKNVSRLVKTDFPGFGVRRHSHEFVRHLDLRRPRGLSVFPPRMILAGAKGVGTIPLPLALPAPEPVLHPLREKEKAHD